MSEQFATQRALNKNFYYQISSKFKRNKAQGMLEFALALPLFLFLVFGIIEFSRIFGIYISVFTASREAARYGSSVGVGSDGVITRDRDCAGIAQVAIDMGLFVTIDPNDVQITYESSPGEIIGSCPNPPSTTLGDRIVVEVSATYHPFVSVDFTPLGIPFRFTDIRVTARNARTIMKDIKVFVTPLPSPNCSADIIFSPNITYSNGNKVLTLRVANQSTTNTAYTLIAVQNIQWLSSSPPRLLKRIQWGQDTIWQDPAGRLPPVNITEWNTTVNRNLFPGETQSMTFEFSNNIKNTYLNFELVLQSTSDVRFGCTKLWTQP